jgi:RNA 3'-terminal phosphate cyclase (ATP)
MIEIDGSFGEGGGQILRTAISLSMVTGRAVRIDRIRANRPRPGLMHQHLTAVKAAQEVCGAEVAGAALGSTELQFTPGEVSHGHYTFSIGTAGSTTLVLQTILPALMTADEATTVTLEGGTHNIHAPSIDFLQRAFLPLLARMGPIVEVELERHGFYPAGGGRVSATITPCPQVKPLNLVERGEVTHRRAVAVVANLPGSIAQRELAVVGEKLGVRSSSRRPRSCR